MNDVPRRPGGSDDERDESRNGARDEAKTALPELASTDQTALRPTERRFGEALPSSGPNEQSSTPMWVARPSDPGTTPGTNAAPPGAADVEGLARGAPSTGDDVPERD